MNPSKPMVSIIVPTYDEAETIEEVILGIDRVMKNTSMKYEIIVVCDGSGKNTLEKVRKYKNIARVFCYYPNIGKGYALRLGFKKSLGNIIITIDSDGSHNPQDILRILNKLMSGYDVVIGVRCKKDMYSTSLFRGMFNSLVNFVIELLIHRRISDSQSGLRGFYKKLLDIDKLSSTRYSIETELTVRMLNSPYVRYAEIPISIKSRRSGKSNLSFIKDGFAIILTAFLSLR